MFRHSLILASVVVAGCASGNDANALRVSVRTDFAPFVDFNTVRIRVDSQESRYTVRPNDDFIAGVLAANIPMESAGVATVEATLISSRGEDLISRSTIANVSGDLTVTLVIARSCLNVRCPDGADPLATECDNGVCVAPECSSERPEACGESQCTDSSSCDTISSSCGVVRCLSGQCLFVPQTNACDASERCVPEGGCVEPVMPMPVDAGMPGADMSMPPPDDTGPSPCMPACEGFSYCVENTCVNAEGCLSETDCDGDQICRNRRCIPPNIDPDGDGQPANLDCNETEPSIYPGAPEACNGIDEDCDDDIDEGNPGLLCAAEGGECIMGACGCPDGRLDLDGVPETGCECAIEPAIGGEARDQAIDLGSVSDSGQTMTPSSNLLPEGREIWYRFRGVDETDTSCDNYHVRVQFMNNPSDAFRFEVFRGAEIATCGTGGFSDYNWATDFRSTIDARLTGQCPCSGSPRPPANQSRCQDDSSDYFIRVFRRDGVAPTCDAFTLEISNGVYDT